MNYYRRFPGDYAKDTQHLTTLEHGIYTLLLDHLYSTERPIATIEDAYRIARVSNSGGRTSCKRVLSSFFILEPTGFTNQRFEKEISLALPRIKAARKNGSKGGRTKPSGFDSANPAQSSPSSIHQPLETPRKKKEAPAAPDARYGPFLEFAKASFEAKHLRVPTWDCFGKDGAALAAFLRRAPHVTLEIWQVHLLNFFESTEGFTLKQGGGLGYFVSRFDTFSAGPILEKQCSGGSNGRKPSVSENIKTTLATMRQSGLN